MALLRQAVEARRSELAVKYITLTLPDGRAPASLLGDAQRLAQLFTILLHNTLRYTDPGGRVLVHLWREGNDTVAAHNGRITVQDSPQGGLWVQVRLSLPT